MTDQIKVEIFVENGISKIKTLSEIPFVFQGKSYVVPKGFVSDGCSVPQMFWGLIAPCIDGRTIRAAIIHDWLYSTAILSRKQADEIFLQLMIEDDFSTWKAYTCYYAVRIFGSSHYGKSAISS